MPRVNVNLIRAFEGPIHERLERIWERLAANYKDYFTLRVFENTGAALRHAEALEEIWKEETKRPEEVAIFTEFDFLPTRGFEWVVDPNCHYSGAMVEAAPYVVRDATTLKQSIVPETAGAWYLCFVKSWLMGNCHDMSGTIRNGLRDGGKFNDPAGSLVRTLQERESVQVKLLESEDCYPDHYGCWVRNRGVHLFWSRHYNDQPYTTVAGFGLAPILKGVKRFVSRYEEALDRCDGAMPPTGLLAKGNYATDFQALAGPERYSLLHGSTIPRS